MCANNSHERLPAVPTNVAHGRRATPMGGPAQRVAEAEPSVSEIPILQRTGLADHAGGTKDEEGNVDHVNHDVGEPKAIASTELPEA
jgi:hypothetical protein